MINGLPWGYHINDVKRKDDEGEEIEGDNPADHNTNPNRIMRLLCKFFENLSPLTEEIVRITSYTHTPLMIALFLIITPIGEDALPCSRRMPQTVIN